MLALCYAEDSQGKVLSGADFSLRSNYPAKNYLKSATYNDVSG